MREVDQWVAVSIGAEMTRHRVCWSQLTPIEFAIKFQEFCKLVKYSQ